MSSFGPDTQLTNFEKKYLVVMSGNKLKNFNAVILADYGKGTLFDTPFLIKESKKIYQQEKKKNLIY